MSGLTAILECLGQTDPHQDQVRENVSGAYSTRSNVGVFDLLFDQKQSQLGKTENNAIYKQF